MARKSCFTLLKGAVCTKSRFLSLIHNSSLRFELPNELGMRLKNLLFVQIAQKVDFCADSTFQCKCSIVVNCYQLP